jgi:hypothetical protein
MLGSLQGVTVRYTGEQLDQSDLDVWEQGVHLARAHPLGNICHFSGYAFLKALRRSTGKAQYKWLDDVITRLVACEVELRTNEKAYGGNLIASWKRDERTSIYKITLNADLVKLYSWNDWTAIDFKQRQLLRGKPLALWLHVKHPKIYGKPDCMVGDRLLISLTATFGMDGGCQRGSKGLLLAIGV